MNRQRGPGLGGTRLSATSRRHAGCQRVVRTPAPRDEARRGSGRLGPGRPSPLWWAPLATEGTGRTAPPHSSRGGRPPARGGKGRHHGARPASSPSVVEDRGEATGHHLPNEVAWGIEGITGNSSTDLIAEWLGLGLVVVGGPTAASTAETEHGSAILRLKERKGSRRGRGRIGCGLAKAEIGRAHV